MNIIDSILKIIDTEKDSTIIQEMLKTMKSYISKLVIIEYLQVYNNNDFYY